jgi:hypothetical protein
MRSPKSRTCSTPRSSATPIVYVLHRHAGARRFEDGPRNVNAAAPAAAPVVPCGARGHQEMFADHRAPTCCSASASTPSKVVILDRRPPPRATPRPTRAPTDVQIVDPLTSSRRWLVPRTRRVSRRRQRSRISLGAQRERRGVALEGRREKKDEPDAAQRSSSRSGGEGGKRSSRSASTDTGDRGGCARPPTGVGLAAGRSSGSASTQGRARA